MYLPVVVSGIVGEIDVIVASEIVTVGLESEGVTEELLEGSGDLAVGDSSVVTMEPTTSFRPLVNASTVDLSERPFVSPPPRRRVTLPDFVICHDSTIDVAAFQEESDELYIRVPSIRHTHQMQM